MSNKKKDSTKETTAFKKFVSAMSVKKEEIDERKAIRFIRVIKRRTEEQITLQKNLIKEVEEDILNSEESLIDLIEEKEQVTWSIPDSVKYEDWITTLKFYDDAILNEKAKKIKLQSKIENCNNNIKFYEETLMKFTN